MTNDKLIVHCPTQELYEKVMEVCTNNEDNYVSSFCDGVRVEEGDYKGFSQYAWYKVSEDYKDYTFLTAEEFLERNGKKYITINKDYFKDIKFGIDWGVYNETLYGLINDGVSYFKKKYMNKLTQFAKDLALTKEEKLLRKYGMQDGEGRWTEDAAKLMRDFSAQDEGFKDLEDMIESFGERLITVSILEMVKMAKLYKAKIIELCEQMEKTEEKGKK